MSNATINVVEEVENTTNHTTKNMIVEVSSPTVPKNPIPDFLIFGKSQKYLNRITSELGYEYSKNSLLPNEGHSAKELFIEYVNEQDSTKIVSPILKGEYRHEVTQNNPMHWAINSIRYIAVMAWLRSHAEKKLEVIQKMNLVVEHENDHTQIKNSYGHINTIVGNEMFHEFMEFVGYEEATIFNNLRFPLCWKLKVNAWKSREWLQFNHNHTAPISIFLDQYDTEEEAAAAVVATVWRRLQPYYKVEANILKPLNLI